MTNDKFDLSRRKVLGSLGVVGTGAVLGGAGTAAYFNDDESSTNNSVTAGELDLILDVSHTHNMGFEGSTSGSGGSNNGITIGDVKPGDYGHIEFCFEPKSNPAWIWLDGVKTADSDNKDSEPEIEAEGSSTDGNGELDEKMNATLRYGAADSSGSVVANADGTLNDVINAINGGELLDSNPDTTDPDHYSANSKAYVTLEWNVPESVGNVIQGDEVKFDLTFYAEQRRHNDNPSNPWS